MAEPLQTKEFTWMFSSSLYQLLKITLSIKIVKYNYNKNIWFKINPAYSPCTIRPLTNTYSHFVITQYYNSMFQEAILMRWVMRITEAGDTRLSCGVFDEKKDQTCYLAGIYNSIKENLTLAFVQRKTILTSQYNNKSV